MTAYQVLLRELDAHGRVTYAQLVERYGDRGYSYGAFVLAAYRARQRGELATEHRGVLVKVGVCPCCGREYEG